MANYNNVTITNNGNVNGLTLAGNGSANLIPAGLNAFAETLLINTGAYQLVLTGSNIGSVSYITILNTSTGSLSLALSASGVVNNLGTISAQSTTGSFNGSNGIPSTIAWGQTFSGLYAVANNNPTTAIFIVTPQ